jgi:glycosyltransferase involved in cell wall biosynthesis
MLGKGWFPSTLGGLDRYYRALFDRLPCAVGVVVGPADDARAEIAAVARPSVTLPLRLLAFWRAAQRAADACDVVDAHFALYAAAPLLVGRLRGRPAVFHFHGPWADESVWTGDRSRLRYRLRRGLERRTLDRAGAFVVLSSAFRRVLVEGYRVAPWEVNVWAPGAPIEEFTPGDRVAARERLGIAHTAFVVACARRLVPRMGIEVLLDAWAELDGYLPRDSTALIVGDGPLRDTLARRVADPALAGRVQLLGRLSDRALLDVYRAADVAAVPTIAFEGFGLVVLEAAACGTPSVVSDAGGLPEAVRDLDPTLIVPAGDVGAWADRLRRASAGALPTRDATRAFAETFNWATVAARHRALYRRVVDGTPDARLRVVYLHPDGQLSADGRALLRQVSHLSAVNAHVILGEDGPLAAGLQTAGISVEVSRHPARLGQPAGSGSALGTHARWALAHALGIIRLARRLRRLRPDVVHANTLAAAAYGSIATRRGRIPLVAHLRALEQPAWPSGHITRTMRRLLPRLYDGVIADSPAALAAVPYRARGRRPPVTAVIADVATAGEGDVAPKLAAEVERQIMTVYGGVLARTGRRSDGATA